MCTTRMWGLAAPILTICIGLAGSSISLYMYTFEDYSYVLSLNSQYGMVIILTVFSIICLIGGSFGICAVLQYKQGMLTAFWIVLLICIFGFAAGAAVGLATPVLLKSYGCLSAVYPAIYTISLQTTLASQRFCTPNNNCDCFINSTGALNITNITGLNSTQNYFRPISTLQCPNWTVGIFDRSIAAFENQFNCAGWCTTNQIYLFSNVNKGNPKSSCFDSFSNWFIDYSKYAYITCFVFAASCFVLVIWVCVFQRFCLQQDEQYLSILESRSMATII